MKILQIINTLDTGGAEKLLLDSIPLFNDKGIQMDLLVFEGRTGIFLKELDALECCNIYSLNSKSLYSPLNILKVIPYLRKYDLIHVHLFPAQFWLIIAKIISLSNTKLIFTEHSTFNRRRRLLLLRSIDKFFYKKYDKIICISNGVKQELVSTFKLELAKLSVIENGIDLKKFENSIPFNKSQLQKSIFELDKLLVQVSKFRLEKDQITVIKCMLLLPTNFKLILVGDGPLRKDCELLVKELSLESRVFFLGNRNDTDKIFKTADLSIVSSHWEGFGLVAVEGMASGKPVLASNVIGLSDIVAGAGFLFEKGNVSELAKLITDILSDQNTEYYIQISKNCQYRSKQFDINTMVLKTITLYNSILNN
jgi:glycosyltransferase involved in cell wall biosynthesis